jgi:hypothetical protein
MKRGPRPIGDKPMTSAERQRRFLDKIRGTGTAPASPSELEAECTKLKAECAKLKSENANLRQCGENQDAPLKVRPQQEFGEVAQLRAEIGKLKSNIRDLKAMLQEEPDAAKLRKKIVDQKVELAGMRQVMKQIAKERDANERRVNPEYRKARQLLTGSNYRVIIRALHSDRNQYVSTAELAKAERLAVGLRPLFIEKD